MAQHPFPRRPLEGLGHVRFSLQIATLPDVSTDRQNAIDRISLGQAKIPSALQWRGIRMAVWAVPVEAALS
jgi:hypothetical protein